MHARRLNTALTIRRTEERLLDLFAQGKISGTVHTCIGEEWIGVAVAEHLRAGDYLFSNHRGHGHYLAWTNDVDGLIGEVMGRVTGVCGGRGGSQHLCRDGFLSNGIQGGIVPVAAGLAMAQSLAGGEGMAVVLIGDGTLGEGVIYEAFNIAAKWSLPLLIVLEDNGIAQSTSRNETLAGSITGRAEAFDIAYAQATTDEPIDLFSAAEAAIDHVRKSRAPLLLHVHTRRLNPHSKGDDTRDADYLRELAAGDVLNQVLSGASPAVIEMIRGIDGRLDHAIEAATHAAPATLAPAAEPSANMASPTWREVQFEPQRVTEAIRRALAERMQQDPRMVFMGEDVRDPYGGAFKVSAGLSTQFGDRVRNLPISEAGMLGVANGLALAGWRPVVEIMFGDFLTLAADQFLNHAAKFAWMYNGQVSVPLILRTPMGGYRGYGPTHSQSLEKHFLGVPGTRVLALTHRYCPGHLYRTLLEHVDCPTLVVENKLLYSRRTDCLPPAGARLEATNALFPTLRLRPAAEDCQLTIVAYGGMVPAAESAIEALQRDEDLACELLIPTQLYPLDLAPVIESVRRTGRLLMVEEGQAFAGFAGEVIAQLALRGDVRMTCARVTAEPCPIPAARNAEISALPDVARILQAARTLAVNP